MLTSANMSPLRIAFVRSPEGKLRLKATLMPANVDTTMAAPVTRFSHTRNSRCRDRTVWLGRQDSNLGMTESKSTYSAAGPGAGSIGGMIQN